MRTQRSFRPALDSTLEGRIALSTIAPVALRNAEFTAPINPTLHTNFSPPRATNGIAIHTTIPAAPTAVTARTTATTGLNLSTIGNSVLSGVGTGLASGTGATSGSNLNSILNTGLSAAGTAGGAMTLGSVLSAVGGNSLVSQLNATARGLGNTTTGGSTLGSTMLASGFGAVNNGVLSGMNLGTSMNLVMPGMQSFTSNTNGAGFGTMV